MMALEIEEEPDFLRLYKLAGLNLVTTYALVAIIGNIARFAHSKNLVSYLGLNPSVVESGNYPRQRRPAQPRARQPARPAHPGQQTAPHHRQPIAKVGPRRRPAARTKTKPQSQSPGNSP